VAQACRPADPGNGGRYERLGGNPSFTIFALPSGMARSALTARSNADAIALEAYAACAGAALACAYSSSAEYDAALIAERRAAGIYGPRRHRRQLLATLAGIAAGITVILFLIF
jgi:hypothetical protein